MYLHHGAGYALGPFFSHSSGMDLDLYSVMTVFNGADIA